MLTSIDTLISLLAKLPGLGPRSARRVALYLLQRRDVMLVPLAEAMLEAAHTVKPCSECGNLDATDPCGICRDPGRNRQSLCVVEQVAHLWAIQRSGVHRGVYHVLGGALSALDGVGPDDLAIAHLVNRISGSDIKEVILALNVTLEGQATAHYLAERLRPFGIILSRLAQGVPIGGELDYLDDGTINAAFMARKPAA